MKSWAIACRIKGLAKVYGSGSAAVHALRGVFALILHRASPVWVTFSLPGIG